VATGREVRKFDLTGGTKVEHYLAARRVWFTPDGKEVGIALQSGVIRYVDPATGTEVRRFDLGVPLRRECPGVVASPDGKLLAVVDKRAETELSLLDTAQGNEVQRIRVDDNIENVAFSSDSAVLALATRSSINLFDVATGGKSKWLSVAVSRDSTRPTIGLTALAFAADRRTLYAGTQLGNILRWKMPGGEALPAIQAVDVIDPSDNLFKWVTAILCPRDGKSLISLAWHRGLIRRWDPVTAKELSMPEGFRGNVLTRLSPDGRLVAASDGDGRLQVFEAATGHQVQTFKATGSAATVLRWSPDGKLLVACQLNDEFAVWELATARRSRSLQGTLDHARSPTEGRPPISFNGISYSPDGRYGVYASLSRGIQMFDMKIGQQLWNGGESGKVAFSPDGASVVCGGVSAADGPGGRQFALSIMDAKTGARRAFQALANAGGENDIIIDLAYAPDCKWLATAHWSGAICLRDPKTAEERRRMVGPAGVRCDAIAFSPDGKWLLSGWQDHAVRLWETATGKEILHRTGHRGSVGSVDIACDFRTAWSSSADGTALRWDLRPPRAAGNVANFWDALWHDLGATDAPKGYQAVWELADDPKSAVPLLREKLPAMNRTVDEKRVRRLIDNLGAELFETREKAMNELAALGPTAVPLLLKALEGERSVEIQHWLKVLIQKGSGVPGAEDLRRGRAVEALELANTAEARALLRDWAADAAHAPLMEEARSALARLEKLDKSGAAAQP
jgi:WD40 repeat protein